MSDCDVERMGEMMAREQDYPEPKEMIVSHWTKNTKYDCPDCGAIKSINYPFFKCKQCDQKFRVKVKMNFA